MGNAPAETREFAYTLWCECGQNLSECHRKMNGEHGYVISRQSLHEWKEKYNWEARAARTEAEKMMMADATSDDAILAPLLKQKEKYEAYFNGLEVGKVDNQAVYGYNAILKTILDIRQKIEDRKKEGQADHVAGAGIMIKTPEDAIAALQTAVENKLNAMLAQTGSVSLKGVQEMEKALVMIEKMKAKYSSETKEKEPATEDDKKRLIDEVDKILGVK